MDLVFLGELCQGKTLTESFKDDLDFEFCAEFPAGSLHDDGWFCCLFSMKPAVLFFGSGSQIDALKKAGVPEKLIFIDKASGAKSERPGFDSCMQELQAGDTLVIWRLDRLGRSLRHLIELIENLKSRGVDF